MLDFNQLSPRHFTRGREFDPAAFAAYKQAAAEHVSVAKWTYILWGVGLLLLILFHDLIGLVVFFGCMGAALAIVTPKYKALTRSWAALGISKQEANEGLVNARNGVYAWDGEVAEFQASSSAAPAPAPAAAAVAVPVQPYPLTTAYLALYLLGGLSVLLLVIDFLTGHSLYLFSYVFKLVIAAYGVALYLLLSDDRRQRRDGLLVLGIGMVLQFIAANALVPQQILHFYQPNILFANSFILIEVLGVGILWLMREKFRGLTGGQKFWQLALWYGIAAAAMTLVYILAYGFGSHFFTMAAGSTVRFIISNILGIFFCGAIVLGVYWITRWLLENCRRQIQLGTGAKVWCWLCIVATTASVIVFFVQSLHPYSGAQYADPIAALIGVFGFILLLRREKIGFMILLAAIATAFLYSAPNYLCYNFAYFLSSLIMLLNPLITWLIIRGAWQRSNLAEPVAAAPGAYYAPPMAPVAPVISQPTSPLREAILAELARRETGAGPDSAGEAKPEA